MSDRVSMVPVCARRGVPKRDGGRLMALGSGDVEIVRRLKREGYLSEPLSVIEIGAQQLANSLLEARDSLEGVGDLFGALWPCPLPGAVRTHVGDGGLERLAENAPAAREFWTWLGFDY